MGVGFALDIVRGVRAFRGDGVGVCLHGESCLLACCECPCHTGRG